MWEKIIPVAFKLEAFEALNFIEPNMRQIFSKTTKNKTKKPHKPIIQV